MSEKINNLVKTPSGYKSILFKQKKGLIAILIIILLLIVFLDFIGVFNPVQHRSDQIANTVSKARNEACSTGLSKVKKSSGGINQPGYYSTNARVETLNYLMNCSFMTHQLQNGYNYASMLQAIYHQQHNTVAEQNLTNFLNYIKQYSQ